MSHWYQKYTTNNSHYSLGSYNLLQGEENVTAADKCRPCDLIVSRCSANNVIPKLHYWRFDTKSGEAQIFYCPNQLCDEGTEESPNRCFDNRDPKYPLCTVCKEGFSEWNGRCIGNPKFAKKFLIHSQTAKIQDLIIWYSTFSTAS